MTFHLLFVGWVKTSKENCSLESVEGEVNSLDECLELCGAHGWCRAALYEHSCYIGDILDDCMVETGPYSQDTISSSTTTSTTTTTTTNIDMNENQRKKRNINDIMDTKKTVFYKSYSCKCLLKQICN